MLKFRYLTADEVDCRVSMCKDTGVSLLLYKDARCDMNILDETVGPERWMRHHSRENANCTVAIHFPELGWVEKEDTGTESNTEAEKGLASDSFKRACFNWGIGRELYTAPFVWIAQNKCSIVPGKNGKPACFDRFRVSKMTVEDGKIQSLMIVNDSRGFCVFNWTREGVREPAQATEDTQTGKSTTKGGKAPAKPQTATLDEVQVAMLTATMEAIGQPEEPLLRNYGVAKLEDLTEKQYQDAMERLSKCKKKGRKS